MSMVPSPLGLGVTKVATGVCDGWGTHCNHAQFMKTIPV